MGELELPTRKLIKDAAMNSQLIRRCVLDERDVMNTWRHLFHGKELTSDSLAKAEALLDGVSGESPLHIRLAKELEEIQKLQRKK